MLYDSFINVKKKLNNSSCLLESTFGFDVTHSLLPIPLKNNASIIYHKNKVYGISSAGGIIVKNINKDNIPYKNFNVKKKFNSNELNIPTKNNENSFRQILVHNYLIIILLTEQKVFIYNTDFQYIESIDVNLAIGCVSISDYLYIITECGITWICLENLDNVIYGNINLLDNDERILGFEKIYFHEELLVYLITEKHVYICNTPVFVTDSESDCNVTQLKFDMIEIIKKIKLPKIFENNKLINSTSIIIDDQIVKKITNNTYITRTYITYFSLDKYLIGIMYNSSKCDMCYYLETNKKYSITQIDNTIFFKNQYSNKLYRGVVMFKDLIINITSDEDFPIINDTLYDSVYVDLLVNDQDNELYYPSDSLPHWFNYKLSNLKTLDNKLIFDGDSSGIVFFSYDYCDIQLLSYIKPFPYYNSSSELIDNSIVMYKNDILILNKLTGLISGCLQNDYQNMITSIDSFTSDDSLFIVPKLVKVKVFSCTDSVSEKIFMSDSIWYDNIFNIIIFTLPTDVVDYVKPFPLNNREYIGLYNVSLTYSSENNYSPIISTVEALGMYNGSSNYTITNGKIKYVKLSEIGHFIKTNVNSQGSLLFSSNYLPIGIIVGYYQKSLLIENANILKLLDKYMGANISKFKINLSYSKHDNHNIIIDVIYKNDYIKDVLYYHINSQKFSIYKKKDLKIITDVDQQIFEIYTPTGDFLAYFYIKNKIYPHENTNIPYYLKQDDYYYLSPLFESLNNLMNDIIDESFMCKFSSEINVNYRKTNMYLKNGSIKLLSIGIHKLNTSNLGINVININDINQNLFELIRNQQNINNNITYADIEKAIYLNIEGFLVTQLSDSFISKNGNQLLGNILDKKILQVLPEIYLEDSYSIDYYHLKKSCKDSIWHCEKYLIYKSEYHISFQNYSL